MQDRAELFLDQLDGIQSLLLAREYHPAVGSICGCSDAFSNSIENVSASLRLYRCQDCSPSFPVCQRCLIRAHRNAPLHWVQRWTGTYFRKTELSKVGLTIHLNHDHGRCPSTNTTMAIDIVDVNGILASACLISASWETCLRAVSSPTVVAVSTQFLTSIHTTGLTFAT